MALSQKTIDVIQKTAPVVAPLARQIVNTFYQDMFIKYPSVKVFFNEDGQRKGIQQKSLSDAVIAYASHISDLSPIIPRLQEIFHKHCARHILPEHYAIVHECLMAAIGKTLPKEALTDEVVAGWSDAVDYLGKACIAGEEQLYKEAEARGWRGFKPLTLTKKEKVATDVISFTFDTERPVTWVSGQYLTVRVKNKTEWAPTVMRHYTVTSKPGESFLQCTVKRLGDDAQVSSYMHDVLAVGDKVEVSIPYGTSCVMVNKPYALLSAGIGVTSSLAAASALQADQCLLVAQVNKNSAAEPFGTRFPTDKQFNTYTEKGRPEAAKWVKEVLSRAGDSSKKDAVFRVCGPPEWMKAINDELTKAGVSSVQTEFFASKH